MKGTTNMNININVDEETFLDIKSGFKKDILIWKTKFKSSLSSYDEIQIIKWQSNEILKFPINQIVVEPRETKYRIMFGENKNNKIKNNIFFIMFFILFLFSFFTINNYQIELDNLKEELTSTQLKNISLEKRVKVCLYEEE